MKLGLHSFSYRYAAGLWDWSPTTNEPMTAVHFLRKAADLSLDGVCLCDPRHLESREYGYITTLRERAEGLGLYAQLGMNGTDPEQLQDLVRVAHVLGALSVRASVDRPRPQTPEAVEAMLEAAAAELTETLPVCERYEIPVVLENTPNLASDELLSLVTRLGGEWVRVCFDTANPLVVLEDPVEAAAALAPSVLTVHLRDYQLAARPDGFTLIGCPLGEGVVDLARVVNLVRRRKPEVIFEVEAPLTRQHVPVLEDAYLSHLPRATAAALGRMLRLVRDRGEQQVVPLPTEREASEDEVLAEEDDQVVNSVHWAQRMLGRPEAEDLAPDE
jgi:sugar phosphate isomerase/epimerase